jgi:ABC-type multidrug transport system ATPase subunit
MRIEQFKVDQLKSSKLKRFKVMGKRYPHSSFMLLTSQITKPQHISTSSHQHISTLAMRLTATNIGKRYNREWIFRGFSYNFSSGNAYAITGPNGSGKSTLLQVLAGALMLTEGAVACTDNGDKAIAPEKMHHQVAIAAPYLELIEEMTATEMLQFHTKFKPLIIDIPALLQQAGLQQAANKQIRYYSSGMKQRLKLAQAIFSNTPVLLLDEPCTNLDAEGIALYQRLVQDYCRAKLVIVSSNDRQEYEFCNEELKVADYKNP